MEECRTSQNRLPFGIASVAGPALEGRYLANSPDCYSSSARLRYAFEYCGGYIMAVKVIGVRQLRDELASVMDEVARLGEVVITQRGEGKAVLVDLDRYNEL